MEEEKRVFPYIPNSVKEVKEQLLEEAGLESLLDIIGEIPSHLRLERDLNLPRPFLSEYALRRHVQGILSKNKNCQEYLSFLGGGTWQHYVPSVCDTILSRDEFLTAYQRDACTDRGKYQAIFEANSMIGELVDLDVVNVPTYDWANAIGIGARMAARMTGRREILVSGTISPSRYQVLENYCKPDILIKKIDYEKKTGLMDKRDLSKKLSHETAALYFENPSYLGVIETEGEELASLAHSFQAEVMVGVDPSSLGALVPPTHYGADMVCGELQPFGIHMQWGGGLAGFLATKDEERYVSEYPSLLFGIARTLKEGELSFGKVSNVRTSYASREKGKDFVGTSTTLYGIIAGVYLALLGPKGLKELGEGIMQRLQYTREVLSEIKGVNAFYLQSPSFKEAVVHFSTPRDVSAINSSLREKKIFGGIDLSYHFPELGNSALFAVTEIHTKEDIHRLAQALKEAIE